ncbi:MAG: hypothetical protein SynsKO_40830 [Synoicihabitans sp.]
MGGNGDGYSRSSPMKTLTPLRFLIVGSLVALSLTATTPETTFQAYLKANNTGAGDFFGDAVAISGDTMVVGASRESSDASGIDGDETNDNLQFAGAAYVFVRDGTTWSQQAYLKAAFPGTSDQFGISVDIDGDTIVVGAYFERSNETGTSGTGNIDAASAVGAAYVFTRSGTTWTQEAYLKAHNSGTNDQFGRDVAISGDSIIVGATYESSNATGVNGDGSDNSAGVSGAAYIFTRSGTTWTQEAYLKAHIVEAGDFFGSDVDIDGDIAVVGALGEDSNATGVNGDGTDNSLDGSGSAYVFVRSGTTWTQEAYLKSNDPDSEDYMGDDVAVSGNTVIIGVRGDDSNAAGIDGDPDNSRARSAGGALIFVREGTTWTQQAYLKSSNPALSDTFGQGVAIDGNLVIVGALGEASNATGVDGDQSNNSAQSSGAAYIFRRCGSAWFQQAYLKSNNPSASDFFGRFVALDGETAVVGAQYEDSNATGIDGDGSDDSTADSGAAYVYALAPDSATPPVMTAWAPPSDGTYIAGQSLDFALTFCEAATVDETGGTPSLTVRVGSLSRQATYASGSGTTNLVFRYTVQADDEDSDGIEVTGFQFNGGTITNASTHAAVVNSNRFGTLPGVLVGASGPAAPSTPDLDATSDSGNSNSDNITTNDTPTFTGTADSGTTVTLFVDENTNDIFDAVGDTVISIGTAVDGTYSLTALSPLAPGNYAVRAVAADGSDVSDLSGALSMTIATPISITGPTSATVVLGSAYTGTINTTGTPTGYTASPLPNGLSFDSASGAFSGIPTTSGTYTITLGASDVASSATISFTLMVGLLEQTISFGELADRTVNEGSFDLSATSSSGLAVTYTIVSGPAMLSGNTVTLTGATGTVVIRADQAGNSTYGEADAVSQSFEVTQDGPLVFFGTDSDGGPFAINIPEGQNTGTLFGSLPNGEFYVLTFEVLLDRTVNAISLTLFNLGSAAADLARTPLRARIADARQNPAQAADLAYTFTGSIIGGQVVMNIAELNLTLNGTVEPPNGPTAELAGLYEANSVDSASGTTTSVVGTSGKVFVLAVTSSAITGGQGTIAADGSFSVTTAESITIAGKVNASDTTLAGRLILPSGSEDAFQGLSTGTARTDRLINLSTRANVDSAAQSNLVTGFVIGGETSKRVLLRAVGPTLSGFGVDNAVADPRITIFNGEGQSVLAIDNWSSEDDTAAATSQTGAFTLAAGSLDAAVVTDLDPGAYTMHVDSQGAGGIALAEIYDASENPNSEYRRLVNISSRGTVSAGNGVLIGGFVVTGNSPKRVLIRGVGPGLAAYGVGGVLADPLLKVFNADRKLVAINEDWGIALTVDTVQQAASPADLTSASNTTGAFSLESGSQDAALIVNLRPGLYTVELTAAAGASATGNALIEIYEIPGR